MEAWILVTLSMHFMARSSMVMETCRPAKLATRVREDLQGYDPAWIKLPNKAKPWHLYGAG
jgi:hypothetical protein